jgi:hypothetical protein
MTFCVAGARGQQFERCNPRGAVQGAARDQARAGLPRDRRLLDKRVVNPDGTSDVLSTGIHFKTKSPDGGIIFRRIGLQIIRGRIARDGGRRECY